MNQDVSVTVWGTIFEAFTEFIVAPYRRTDESGEHYVRHALKRLKKFFWYTERRKARMQKKGFISVIE
jgi:hypothetical protein